ncbi:MAG TPA: HYR domain-containing protein, partial [Thermoanaerobaculia bacterium]|nr:HYR domain-containing protein [Thermoanaerobaculia bacterium]
MKTAAICLLLCVFIFVPAVFADSITSIAPSAFLQGDIERFIEIDGTGLVGTVDTQVILSGPFGTTTVEGSPGADDGTVLFVSIPDFVLSVPGTVSVTVEAIDDTATRTIGPGSFDVISNGSSEPPLLSLPESITAEATSASGAVVTFTVSAQSFNSGDPVPVTCDHNSGDLYPVAITTVHCSATDAFGTTSGTFEINVSDTVGPVLNLPATIITDNPVVTYTVTATDNTDPSPDVFCSPASGSTFPVGTTTVQCTAIDSHANSTHGSFNVSVTGGVGAPVITVPSDITAEATSAAGRAVSFTVTATDNATILCSPASGSTFPLGTTTVTCSASTAGGTSSDSFHVTIVDTTPPVLTLPGTINKGATSPAGAVVTFTATATDLVAGSTPVFCNPPSGSTFPIGTTVVTCSSADNNFNTVSGTFQVIVSADVTPPVLTLPSNITAEATSAAGAVVTFTATAVDD